MNLTAKTKGVKEEILSKILAPNNLLQNWRLRGLRQLDDSTYCKIINVMIMDDLKRWIKIDGLIVSDFGIHVINYNRKKGTIYGCDDDCCWISDDGRYVNRFTSPVLYNQRGINALKNLLQEYPNIRYHNTIAFSNKSELYIEAESNIEICHASNLAGCIQQKRETNIGIGDKHNIYKKIKRQSFKYKIDRQKSIEALIARNRKRMLKKILKKSIKSEQ